GPLPGPDRRRDRARARAPLRDRLRRRPPAARRRERPSGLSGGALSSGAARRGRGERGEGDATMRGMRRLGAGLGALLLAAAACERSGAAPKKKWFVGASIDRLSND